MPLAWITTVAYRRAINFTYRRARQDPEWPAVPEVPEERLGHGHAAAPTLWLEATELLRALAGEPATGGCARRRRPHAPRDP